MTMAIKEILVVFIAWLFFCSGAVTLYREMYTYAVNSKSQHGDNMVLVRWVWSALAFTIWYVFLF